MWAEVAPESREVKFRPGSLHSESPADSEPRPALTSPPNIRDRRTTAKTPETTANDEEAKRVLSILEIAMMMERNTAPLAGQGPATPSR